MNIVLKTKLKPEIAIGKNFLKTSRIANHAKGIMERWGRGSVAATTRVSTTSGGTEV